MKRLILASLAFAFALFAGGAHAAWNADWTKRMKLGLNTAADGLALPAGADSVPLLVRLHTGNFQFIDAKPDGSDLRFIAADDKTPLKFHIEKFDGLNELALVWVQMPKLAPGVKTDYIWLYYGNANAPAGGDAKGSYDASQALVYHFGEKEALPQDATANANHAARSSAKPSAAGMIGGGLSFDGSSELTINDSPSLHAGAGALTVSFWMKPAKADDAVVYAQDGGLQLSLRGGALIARLGSLTTPPTAPLAPAAWAHVSVVAKDGLVVYVNGQEAARVAGSVPAVAGNIVIGKGWTGELDELEIASTARTADWIRAVALSEGPDQKLLNYAPAEGGSDSGGPSYLKILLGAVTPDGWVVIGLLMVMFIISVAVMISKAMAVNATARDNDRFKGQFDKLLAEVKPGAAAQAPSPNFRHSSLYHLFSAGVHELQRRVDSSVAAGHGALVLSDQSINAIRATVDARLVRENQRLNSKMVLLTIAIAGGPFLGLLGTVVGVMITFAAIAAAGDVNVNAIAPGIAAALVATVAGLAVAIPALFGYNYLGSRIAELHSDMQVFVDEFITRIAENHSV